MQSKIEYNAGFLVARLLGIDESSGEDEIVEGRHVRFRCSEVSYYSACAAGMVELSLAGYEEPFVIVGTVAQVDTVMKQDRMFVIKGGS